MPFVSAAQKGWMYANHPAMAKRWQKETPKGAKLPRHVKRKKKRGSKRSKARGLRHRRRSQARGGSRSRRR